MTYKHPAEFTVHTPTGPVHSCVKHARQIEGFMRMLGAHTHAVKVPDGVECATCSARTAKGLWYLLKRSERWCVSWTLCSTAKQKETAMFKLALQQPKRHPMHLDKILPWASCAPFVQNSRGVLIHRPRSAQTVTIHREPHTAIHYWCGNGVAGKCNLTFLSAPPADRLLCEACERNAVLAGLPSAHELAGRHVHLGKLKAVQTCYAGKTS